GVGDFDGDRTTDLVTSDGVLRVTGTGPWTLQPLAAAGQPFGGAIVSDLNGDGLPDVAAFRAQQPDVEVLIDNAGLTFDSFVVSTAFTVVHLESGDFDGDLTRDLAIVEKDTTGTDPVFVVSVSYGSFHGPPGPRVAMDRFTSAAGIIAANLVSASGQIDGAS